MVTENGVAPRLLGDDPRNGSIERPDELERGVFVRYLQALLENVREQSESSVMGLIGAWGSGKTSVLELLRTLLSDGDEATWLVAEFNPWTYAGPQHLQQGFFAELMAVLPKETRSGGARARIGELARAVSPLGAVGGLIGVDAEGVIRALGDHLVGDASASAAKRVAEVALRGTRRPILMVIDDLDRLTPDELLEVLKLVRLVGRLPHVYYLLCYDERTLLDVLRRTPLAGENEDRARAYLEKIVQVRLDMPALRESQRLGLLNRGLDAILESTGVLLTPADEDRLSEAYSAVLDRRLTTPRSISRFLGQMQAFYPPLHGEVDFVDFLLVSWLRTQEPGVYAMLQERRDAVLGGHLGEWSYARDRAAAKERHDFWQNELAEANIEPRNLAGVVRLLSGLFPHLQAAFASADTYNTPMDRPVRRAVSNKDYFDRYVSFGVPNDDISDSTVARALASLASGTESDERAKFTVDLVANTSRAVRKIRAHRESGAIVPERALFELLAEVSSQIDVTSKEPFVNPRRVAQYEAARCLMHLDPDIAVHTAERLSSDLKHTDFVASVVHRLHRDQRSQYPEVIPENYDLTRLTSIAERSLARRLDSVVASSPFGEGAMSGYWMWWHLAPEAASGWLRGMVDSGTWTLLDTVGALTSVATSFGSRSERTGIGGLDLDQVEAAFTLDRVMGELAADIDSAPPFHNDPLDTPATEASRKHYALWVLRGRREPQAAPSGNQPDGSAEAEH